MKRVGFLLLALILINLEGYKPKDPVCGDPIRDDFSNYCVEFEGLCPFIGDTSLLLSGQIDPTKIVVYDQDRDTIQHVIEDSCIKINLKKVLLHVINSEQWIRA